MLLPLLFAASSTETPFHSRGFATGDMTAPLTVDWSDNEESTTLVVVNKASDDQVVAISIPGFESDDGWPIKLRAKSVITFQPGGFTGFTLSKDSGVAGDVDVYWW